MHHLTKFKFSTIWIIVVATGILTCNVDAQSTFTGTTMGPISYKAVVCDDVKNFDATGAGIANELEKVNSLMSTYIDDSDVSRVNFAKANEWTTVDPLTFAVIKKAIEISQSTDGAFDITVGPAVRRWQFGPDSESVNFPSDQEVDEIRQHVGYQHISLRADPPAIMKAHDKTEVDLSAIAKGFAVDRVAKYLKQQGHANFMVEVGGEVYAAGRKPDGPWRIGIEKPQAGSMQVQGVVEISDSALATSGDYRNFRMHNGRRISHTIDPQTCRPVANPPASCSIMAKDCMTADAIATAIMVMGGDAGIQFCNTNELKANIISRAVDDDSKLDAKATTGFPLIEPLKKNASQPRETQSIWPAFIGAMVVFSLAIAGMAVGAIFNQKPITGSCGGIATEKGEDGETSCSMCHKPVTDCPDQQPQDVSA